MSLVSGIQPTGNLHLGNYLGAIRNWVRMQELEIGAVALGAFTRDDLTLLRRRRGAPARTD